MYRCDAACAARTRANALTRVPRSFCGSCRATASTTIVAGATPSPRRTRSPRSVVRRPKTTGSRPRGMTSIRARGYTRRRDMISETRSETACIRTVAACGARVERLSRSQADRADPRLCRVFWAVRLVDEARHDARPSNPRSDPPNDVALEERRVHEVGSAVPHEVGEPPSLPDPAAGRSDREQLGATGLDLVLEAVGLHEGRHVELRFRDRDSGGPMPRESAPPHPDAACRSGRGRGAVLVPSTVGAPLIG